MIAWKYVNKNAAAIAAMRDYKNMKFLVENTPDSVKEAHSKMFSPGKAKITGMPSARNPRGAADRLPAQIDKMDAMRERYGAAVEFMDWFEPAWDELSEKERHILSEYYLTGSQKSGATYRLMFEYNYGERKIEKMRSNALRRLRILLYG